MNKTNELLAGGLAWVIIGLGIVWYKFDFLTALALWFLVLGHNALAQGGFRKNARI